jgi:hypothetical protein
MGTVQEVAPDKAAALELAIGIANRISACGLLGIRATLEVAHVALNNTADPEAYAKLQADYVALSGRRISPKVAGPKLKTGLRSSTVDSAS